jgi:hypothetical protein
VRPVLDFVSICIRIPKSGSATLWAELVTSGAFKTIYKLPSTVDFDGALSFYHHLRFIRHRLRNNYKDYGMYSDKKVFRYVNEHISNGDLIGGGHLEFATVSKQIHSKLRLISVVRNPFDRCVSDYNYSRNTHKDKNILKKFRGAIVKKIAVKYDFDGFLDFLAEHKEIYGNQSTRYVGWNGSQDLSAFERENVFHWGTLEKYQEFLRGFYDKVGKTQSEGRIHKNAASQKFVAAVNKSQMSKIEGIFDLDLVLWDWLSNRPHGL